MAIFTKDTALEIAYIGAGAVAGKFVGRTAVKYLPSAVTTALPFDSEYLEAGIPIAVGLFLPSLAGRTTIVRGLANGMIASGASTIVGKLTEDFIPSGSTSADSGQTPTQGVGNVMMGNVMMSGSDSILMSGAGDSDYSATSYDFTPAYAGEMDY